MTQQQQGAHAVLCAFSAHATYLGDSSSMFPLAVLPAFLSLTTTTRRLGNSVIPAPAASTQSSTGAPAGVSADVSHAPPPPAAAVELLTDRLKGKVLFTTVAVDVSHSALEILIQRLFTGYAISGVVVVSKPFAIAASVGHERLRVVDFGWECLSCSFVNIGGVVEAAAVSRSLGLSKAVDRDLVAGQNSLGETQWSKILQLLFAGNSRARGPFFKLLKQLPRESKGTPVVLSGDALEMTGLAAALMSWLKNDDGEEDDEREALDVLDFTSSRPWLSHFSGLSLISTIAQHESQPLLLTRQEYLQLGPSAIHWRCPGLAPPLFDPSTVV